MSKPFIQRSKKIYPAMNPCFTDAQLERNYEEERDTSYGWHCYLDGNLRFWLGSVIG
jgi:hypothetical protein